MRHFVREKLCLGVVLCCLGSAAIAQDHFSQPSFTYLQDGMQLTEFLEQTIGFAQQNPARELGFTPPEVEREGLGRHFRESTVSRWTLEWSESDWNGFVEHLERFSHGPPLGIDQQPVDPEAATGAYTDPTIGDSNWNARVGLWEQAKKDAGLQTCKAAISALYAEVCSAPSRCDVEDEYRSNCVVRHQNTTKAMSCVAIVNDYGTACFDGPGLNDFNYDHLSGGGTSEPPLCGVASFSHGGQLAFATAEHCVDGLAIRSRFHRSHQYPAQFSTTDEGPFGTYGDFSFLVSQEAPQFFERELQPLGTGKAIQFAPTIFAGTNALAYMANEVRRLNGTDGERFALYWVDRSPLCTVVQYDEASGQMLHTCQTTNGGSGGILVQKHDDTFVVVGINTGPSENDQNTTNVAQFASGSAFADQN